MKPVAKSAVRRVRFATVATALAAIGCAFAAGPVSANTCAWKTHTGKKVCFYIKGFESSYTTHDNTAYFALYNSATGGNHEKLKDKTYYNNAGSRDKWYCHDLSSFTTKPGAACQQDASVLNGTGKIVMNSSAESPKYFNLHQAKKRICIMAHRNSNGSAWNQSPGSSDVWDIEQRNTDGDCWTP